MVDISTKLHNIEIILKQKPSHFSRLWTAKTSTEHDKRSWM